MMIDQPIVQSKQPLKKEGQTKAMGVSLGKLLSNLFGNKEMRVLMLGLDAAGKTSMLEFSSIQIRFYFSLREINYW